MVVARLRNNTASAADVTFQPGGLATNQRTTGIYSTLGAAVDRLDVSTLYLGRLEGSGYGKFRGTLDADSLFASRSWIATCQSDAGAANTNILCSGRWLSTADFTGGNVVCSQNLAAGSWAELWVRQARALGRTKGVFVLAIDTETALIRPGVLAPPLTCVSSFDGEVDETPWLLHVMGEGTAGAAEAMLNGSIVGHNIAYDMAVLCAEWPELIPHVFAAYDADRVTDTMIRQRLIDIAFGQLDGYRHPKGFFVKHEYNLAAVYKRHTKKELPKPAVRQQYGALRTVPLERWPDEAISYAKDDARATWEVWAAQEESFPKPPAVSSEGWILADQYRQARAAFALHLASCWGMVTDPHAIRLLEGATREAYEKALATCKAAGYVRPNGTRDTKATKRAMITACAKVGIEPKVTKSVEAASDDEAAEKLAKDPLWGIALDEEACLASGDETLKAYAELSSLMTVVDTHIPALKNGLRAPIQPRFNVLVDTGRTSCAGHDSKSDKPSSYGYQVQNIRRLPGIRECFVARPGYVFIDADYSALELHTWAQVCLWAVGRSALAEALNQGVDPHIVVACELLGEGYETVAARIKAGDKEAKEARQFAKIANFGFMGGMGANTFRKWARVAYGTNFDEGFANQLRATWKSTWPESEAYFKWITDQVDNSGDPDGAHVVHFMSERHRGPLGFTVCANTYFQGLGADAAKSALWAVVRETYLGRMAGAHVVNFIHDEIVTEAPEDVAAEYAEIQAEIMVSEAHKWLPDVKPKVEFELTRRLSKEAKAVRDASGRLVPWDWDPEKVFAPKDAAGAQGAK